MNTNETHPPLGIIATDAATGILPVPNGKPITVIGTNPIRASFGELTLKQAMNTRLAPGVTDVVLNPDAHVGYGAPVGSVLVSPTHIYPGPVGVDIKCSMSLLQMNIPADAIRDKTVRRALIDAITKRTPTGAGRGQRHAKLARKIGGELGYSIAVEGASEKNLYALGIPLDWAGRCEDAFHRGHDGTVDALVATLDQHLNAGRLGDFEESCCSQLGSYGGGNHFGECEVVHVTPGEQDIADVFGLKDGCVGFLSHCGSRGLGHRLARHQFTALNQHFAKWNIPVPAGDKELVYAPLGSAEADAYINDMSIGANWATMNHLLINTLVLEAFQEVLPGTKGELVYFISHNIARQELTENGIAWVHRKGATRAFPGGHPGLRGTRFEETGHPILLPGNPREGSVIMVADAGAAKSQYSVNHGAGRALARRQAMRTLKQQDVDFELAQRDIMSNCRQYPLDEAPDAYKDFNEVLKSVELAGLARPVAKLDARFVIKDASTKDD